MPRPALSRRQFLQTSLWTGSALAAPTVVPVGVLGANAPSNRLNLAVIGAGTRGRRNVTHNSLPRDDVRILSVCHCFEKWRESFAKAINEHYASTICTPTVDYRQVLDRDDTDGVILSTPDHWHVPIAVAAAEAGKDMYVEKPLGVAMTWAWRLREAVRKHEVVFQYGTQQRSARHFRLACELAINNYVGPIEHVTAWCPDISANFDDAHTPPHGSTKPTNAPARLAVAKGSGRVCYPTQAAPRQRSWPAARARP
jgi:predicted dehydrogenase